MEFEEVLRSDRKENIPIAYFWWRGGVTLLHQNSIHCKIKFLH